jgi:hypothetical protein
MSRATFGRVLIILYLLLYGTLRVLRTNPTTILLVLRKVHQFSKMVKILRGSESKYLKKIIYYPDEVPKKCTQIFS